MVGGPLGSLLSQWHIGSSRDLGTQAGFLVGRDEARSARRTLWEQITLGAAQAQPAFDTATTDLEDADGVRTGHTSIECVQDAYAEVG